MSNVTVGGTLHHVLFGVGMVGLTLLVLYLAGLFCGQCPNCSGTSSPRISSTRATALRIPEDYRGVIVVGHNSCPACQATKKGIADMKLEKQVLFIDVATPEGKAALQAAPKDVSDAVNKSKGIPVLMARKPGEPLNTHTGYSPDKLKEMCDSVRSA